MSRVRQRNRELGHTPRKAKFIMKKGLIYRQFTLRGKTTSQLVVPSSLNDKVMTLAHESLMAGHLGIQKTID